jgi:ubiquinone/menaquinone biosynthesis C-methylase UbiE
LHVVGHDFTVASTGRVGRRYISRRPAHKIARRRLDNVTLHSGSAAALPFDDSSFDAVVSSLTLPHITRPARTAVLEEMSRVLRPGGLLGPFLAQGEIAPRFSTRPELEEYLADAGFVDCHIEDRDDVYRVAKTGKPPARRR